MTGGGGSIGCWHKKYKTRNHGVLKFAKMISGRSPERDNDFPEWEYALKTKTG